MKFLANEPTAAIMGLGTALNLCVTAFGGALLNVPEQTAVQAVILAVCTLWARAETTPTASVTAAVQAALYTPVPKDPAP